VLGYFKWLMKPIKTLYSTLASTQWSEAWQKLKPQFKILGACLRVLCVLVIGVIGLVVITMYTDNIILLLVAAFFFTTYLLYSLELLERSSGENHE